jgi:hypothetical protein
VPSPNLNLSAPIDLEQLLTILLPQINDAVHRSFLRYKDRIRQDELDDLSQQISIKLIDGGVRALPIQTVYESWPSGR